MSAAASRYRPADTWCGGIAGRPRSGPRGLREQALSALRRAITTGQLAPGTHLVETDLSDALQISRGTLREAMRQLQQEGLISAGARGRLSVRHLDAKEIRDIFNVRAALESLAARELASRPDRSAAVATLRQAVADMEKWAASRRVPERAGRLPRLMVPRAVQRQHPSLGSLTGITDLSHGCPPQSTAVCSGETRIFA